LHAVREFLETGKFLHSSLTVRDRMRAPRLLVGSVRLGLIANSRRNAGAYKDGHQEREDADSDRGTTTCYAALSESFERMGVKIV
jgi:hypothetical protein